MEQQNQLLEVALNQSRVFFESSRTGDDVDKPYFFRLHSIKSIEASSKGVPSFYQNFNHPDLDESLQDLVQAITLFGPTQKRYIVVSLVTNKTANNNNQLTIQNPYYTGATHPIQQGGHAGISGFGGYNNPYYPQQIAPPIFEIQKQYNASLMEMTLKIKEMEHQQNIKDKDNEIAALEHNNIGKIQKIISGILDYTNTEAGKPLTKALISKIMGGTPEPVNAGQPQSDTALPPTTEPQEKHNEGTKQITTALMDIQEVFPDLSTAMTDLARLVKTQPDMARQMLAHAKMQDNG